MSSGIPVAPQRLDGSGKAWSGKEASLGKGMNKGKHHKRWDTNSERNNKDALVRIARNERLTMRVPVSGKLEREWSQLAGRQAEVWWPRAASKPCVWRWPS